MITTLLIDDEVHNRQMLRILIENNFPRLKIVDEAATAEEAFAKINTHKPSLVFLDIKMPRKSGFDLLRMLPQINFETIFVTAFDRYAIKAFEFNAIGYVLKPIDEAKFINAVEGAIARINSNLGNDLVLHLVQKGIGENNLLHNLTVHHNDKVFFVEISEILSIESETESVTITLYDNTHYYSSKRLTEFEAVLEGAGNFIRISKSVIINTSHMKAYSKSDTCTVYMKNNAAFEISRRRKTEILRKLKTIQ